MEAEALLSDQLASWRNMEEKRRDGRRKRKQG